MTEHVNPYSPPKSNIEIPKPDRSVIPVGKGRRFGTFLIDYLLVYVFAFCFGFTVMLLFGEAGNQALQKIPNILLGVILMLTYYIFFEGIWAQTPGKLLFGTIVVNESGGNPTLRQVVERTLCRFIPFEALSFLGDRGWHDSISKTYVVLARSS